MNFNVQDFYYKYKKWILVKANGEKLRSMGQMVWKAVISSQNWSEHGYTKTDCLSAQNTVLVIYKFYI